MSALPLAIPTPFRLTPTGLSVVGSPSFEEWRECGVQLHAAHESVQWAIAEWLNYGKERWGEMYAKAVEATGLDYQTLATAKWVASRFDCSRRREQLTFKHHREVASLPPAEADAILDRAETEKLSTRQVRALVKEAKTAAREPEPFLPFEEAAALADWLRSRRESWPADFRHAFVTRVRLILDEMEGADADH